MYIRFNFVTVHLPYGHAGWTTRSYMHEHNVWTTYCKYIHIYKVPKNIKRCVHDFASASPTKAAITLSLTTSLGFFAVY